MRLAFQFISLINIYAAVPIALNNSSDGLTNTEERSGGTVFAYQTSMIDENNSCGYSHWDIFNQECVWRGHDGLATRKEVLELRQVQEIPIDSSSSWTPVQGRHNWMQIGTQSKYIYGSFNRKCDDFDTSECGVSPRTKKEVYCRGGAPKDYTYDCPIFAPIDWAEVAVVCKMVCFTFVVLLSFCFLFHHLVG